MWIVYATFERQTDHDVKISKKREIHRSRKKIASEADYQGNFTERGTLWLIFLLEWESAQERETDSAKSGPRSSATVRCRHWCPPWARPPSPRPPLQQQAPRTPPCLWPFAPRGRLRFAALNLGHHKNKKGVVGNAKEKENDPSQMNEDSATK